MNINEHMQSARIVASIDSLPAGLLCVPLVIAQQPLKSFIHPCLDSGRYSCEALTFPATINEVEEQ